MSLSRLPVLYSFRRCPYAIRARLAIARAGVVCELREILLRDKPAAMLALSPKGTVPILRLPGGAVIDESLDIIDWALAQADPDDWLHTELPLARALIDDNDRAFKPLLDRYKYHERYPEQPQVYYREQASGFLKRLDKQLAAHAGRGLTGPRTGLADVAIFPFIRQFAGVNRDWFDAMPWTQVSNWLRGWEAGALFQGVMKKYPVWRPGATGEQFP